MGVGVVRTVGSVRLGGISFALGLLATSTVLAAEHRIRFGNVDFDPVAEAARFRAAPETPDGKALRLVQFEDTPRQAWLDALAARGAQVLQYYPGRAYLVWSDAAALDVGEASLPLRWVGDYSPDFKLAPDLVGRLGTIENVHLLVVNEGNLVPLQAQIEDQGAKSSATSRPSPMAASTA
jgi:hypothetical protein